MAPAKVDRTSQKNLAAHGSATKILATPEEQMAVVKQLQNRKTVAKSRPSVADLGSMKSDNDSFVKTLLRGGAKTFDDSSSSSCLTESKGPESLQEEEEEKL